MLQESLAAAEKASAAKDAEVAQAKSRLSKANVRVCLRPDLLIDRGVC